MRGPPPANPYGYNGYSRETTNQAQLPMNMAVSVAPPIAPPTPMATPIAPPTPINMAPPLEYNIPQRLETPQTSFELPIAPQNQAVQYQANQGGMQYGTNGAPAQLTYTGYTVGPNGIPQKITTMETTTVSQVETTPTVEAPPPVEVNESRCCCPRDSDELHYSYSNLSDSLAGRMFRVILLIIPIFMVTIGYFYIEHCPYRHMIPYWLITSGVAWIINTLFYFLFRNNPGKNTAACRFIETTSFLASAAWLVFGSTLTFGSVRGVSFRNETHTGSFADHLLPGSSVDLAAPYCHPVPFITTAIIICLAYVAISVLIFFVCFTFQYSYNLNPPSQRNLPVAANQPITPAPIAYARA